MTGTFEPDATWIRARDRRLVIAGSPPSLYRIGAAAAGMLDHPTGASTDEERAARDTLVTSGALHRTDPTPVDATDLVVAVPAHVSGDVDAGLLVACVTALAPLRVVVVDDASPVDLTGLLADRSHCRVLAHDTNRGPAAARNTALAAVRAGTTGWTARFVCFVDLDVVAEPDALLRLAGHLGHDGVICAAPRVVASPATGWLGRYEAHQGALDMGPVRARVRPGSRVPYVPTAALVVDADAAHELGGFDETLRVGEDVDFVWRAAVAHAAGVYDPDITVSHRPRANLVAFLRQRFTYGTSAAALARRHGAAVAPWRGRVIEALGWISLAAATFVGWPFAAAGVALLVGTPGVATRALSVHGVDVVTGSTVAARSLARSAHHLGLALTRAWWPVASLVAVLSASFATAVVAVFVVLAAADWVTRPAVGTARLDPPRFLAARIADHLAHGCGLWWGAVRGQRPTAVAPSLSR